MEISERGKEIADRLYRVYGTDGGILFGIGNRETVEIIVQLTLNFNEKMRKECEQG